MLTDHFPQRRAAIDEFAADMAKIWTSALRKIVPDAATGCLLDIPFHSNVGDTAIWWGEIIGLRKAGIKVLTQTSIFAHQAKAAQVQRKADCILLHGGGNFGDLWPHLHDFRLKVVSEFKDSTIIQLPQSVTFLKPESIKRTADVLGKHPHFYLMVRDRESFAVAKEIVPEDRLFLVPDSALLLGALKPPHSPTLPVLRLLRSDHEAAGETRQKVELVPSPGEIRTVDWLEQEGRLGRLEHGLADWGNRLDAKGLFPIARRFQLASGELRMKRGLGMLCHGETVVTDRLHATVLAGFMGRDVFYADTKHKKIRNVLGSWLEDRLPWVRDIECKAQAAASDPNLQHDKGL